MEKRNAPNEDIKAIKDFIGKLDNKIYFDNALITQNIEKNNSAKQSFKEDVEAADIEKK